MTLDEVRAIREDMVRIEELALSVFQASEARTAVAKRKWDAARKARTAAYTLENYAKGVINGTHGDHRQDGDQAPEA